MRVFVTKAFWRFQRKESIEDETLCEAIARAERGLIDADLGSGLIKQRVARIRQGRRGGYRTIIAYRTAARSAFLYGFSKSAQANISAADRRDLTDYGRMLLDIGEDGIAAMIAGGELREIECHDEE